jgi:glycosyltransferase involved in cell wall biosynthesis
VQHGCYRGSRAQSASIALSMAANYGTWRGLDRYLALTPQIAAHLASAGIPAERVVVRPNTVADPGYAQQAGSGFVYVGRLDTVKGINLLIEAWQRHEDGALGTLTFVGEGEQAAQVQRLAARRTDVQATGLLSPYDVRRVMSRAAVVVIPSLVPDVFPRVVVEALALGKPVVGTEVGGLPGILTPETGWLVPRDPGALSAALRLAAGESPSKRRAARQRFVEHYSPEKVLQQLLDVYAECIAASGAPQPR